MPSAIIQPATYDTYISSFDSTTNFDSSMAINVGTVYVNGYKQKGLISFDFSSLNIVEGSTITSAVLSLYIQGRQSNAAGKALTISHLADGKYDYVSSQAIWANYKTGSAWSTAGCNHSTNDYTTVNEVTIVPTNVSTGTYLTWNVKDQIQHSLLSHSGIWKAAIRGDEVATYSGISFASSNSSSQTTKPKLTIIWEEPPIIADDTIDISDNQMELARKNLLTNPSFTDSFTGWSGSVPQYDYAKFGYDVYYDPNAVCSVVDVPVTGKAVYLSPTVANTNRFVETALTAIDTSKRATDWYNASVSVKQTATTANPEIVLQAYTASGQLLGSKTGTGTKGTSSWAVVSTGNYRLPAGTTQVRVRLTAKGTGEYWYDKTMLEKNNVSMPTAYSDFYYLTGTYETVGIDTHLFAAFGKLDWVENVPSGCDITFKTKTAPGSEVYGAWSASLTEPGQTITSTLQDFLKLQATLTSDGLTTPILYSVAPYASSTTTYNSCSLKITSPSSVEEVFVTSQTIPIKPETTYTAGVRFKTELDSGTINLNIEEYDVEDTLLETYSVIDGGLSGENEWGDFYDYTFTTSGTASYLKMVIAYDGQGAAWADQVCLYEGNTLTTYFGDGWINWFATRDGGTTWYDITDIVNGDNYFFAFPEDDVTRNEIAYKAEFNRSVVGNMDVVPTPFIHSFRSELVYEQ